MSFERNWIHQGGRKLKYSSDTISLTKTKVKNHENWNKKEEECQKEEMCQKEDKKNE